VIRLRRLPGRADARRSSSGRPVGRPRWTSKESSHPAGSRPSPVWYEVRSPRPRLASSPTRWRSIGQQEGWSGAAHSARRPTGRHSSRHERTNWTAYLPKLPGRHPGSRTPATVAGCLVPRALGTSSDHSLPRYATWVCRPPPDWAGLGRRTEECRGGCGRPTQSGGRSWAARFMRLRRHPSNIVWVG
jgi:hypothetical protein